MILICYILGHSLYRNNKKLKLSHSELVVYDNFFSNSSIKSLNRIYKMKKVIIIGGAGFIGINIR